MNPYENLPEKAFWKPAVAARSLFDLGELWDPKFDISPKDKIATYGSCFAQHIGRSLRDRGFGWLITENEPYNLSPSNRKLFNYGVFTSRTGNIYTTSLMRQWTDWALNDSAVPTEIWKKNGRVLDPFRPVIEPDGFISEDELRKSQACAVDAFKSSILKADYLVFTLGLTESWINVRDGFEYPMCPGTAAGDFNSDLHAFRNQNYDTIIGNLRDVIAMMKAANPSLKFILTVSPVPLTATMSGEHVLVATMASKSILRAVAGQIAAENPDVDYFPSYEIINSPVIKGAFFEPNQRNVNPYGVNFVMESFFKCLFGKFGEAEGGKSKRSRKRGLAEAEAEVCEEELLGAFNQSK